MGERSVAIVGMPECGKSVLLTVLCKRRAYREALNEETFNWERKHIGILELGNWSEWESTDPSTKAPELKWRVKHGKCSHILQSRDFAGELWRNFISKYGNADTKHVGGDDDEIATFIKSSFSIIVCVDLQKIINGDTDSAKNIWMVQAVKNFLNSRHIPLDRMAIAITKYDAIRDFVKHEGGEDERKGLLKILYPKLGRELTELFRDRIFPVSAAEFEYDPQTSMYRPKPGSSPLGLPELERWLYRRSRLPVGLIIPALLSAGCFVCCFIFLIFIILALIAGCVWWPLYWGIIILIILLIGSFCLLSVMSYLIYDNQRN